MIKCSMIHPEHSRSANELKDVFFLIHINKSSGFDDIYQDDSYQKFFDQLDEPLLRIFNLSLERGIFSW